MPRCHWPELLGNSLPAHITTAQLCKQNVSKVVLKLSWTAPNFLSLPIRPKLWAAVLLLELQQSHCLGIRLIQRIMVGLFQTSCLPVLNKTSWTFLHLWLGIHPRSSFGCWLEVIHPKIFCSCVVGAQLPQKGAKGWFRCISSCHVFLVFVKIEVVLADTRYVQTEPTPD